SSCRVQGDSADCSHLSLDSIPPDLPGNLTSLDMSHNRLRGIPPEALRPYPGLLRLIVNYNSIAKLDGRLCETLPRLRTLNVAHNQLLTLREEDLNPCSGLTELNLSSNRLRLQGEPFSGLQNLKYLDVSLNKLQSARLGSRPQLPALVTLSLAHDTISVLRRDDFSFLNHSSFFRVLNLSSVLLKEVHFSSVLQFVSLLPPQRDDACVLLQLEPGCLKPISGLSTVILDGTNTGTQVIAKLCSELSGTAISTLSLRNMKLVTLTNNTFVGLQKTNLSCLDLSRNGLGRIEKGSFLFLPRLQTLILEENNIKHLTSDTFQGLHSLKSLQLTKALVKGHTSANPVIDDFSFQPLKALESLVLQKTAIWKITPQTFTGLTSLMELDLSWSSCVSLKNITNQTFVSLAGSPLRKLNLTGTAITQISPGGFSALRNLTVLLLDSNFIRQTFSGRELEGLAQLEEMHMSLNYQKVNLSSASFVAVPSLRVLTLGKSLISTALNLDPSPFSPLVHLSYLDLSNNNIANIRRTLLKGLGRLKVLKLQHNNFARLWKNANPGGPVMFLQDAVKLRTLLMDSNGLDEIPAEALRGLTELQELSLGSNLLNSLRDSVFNDLTSLQALYLEKNMITTVRPEVFKTPMSNLGLLVMGRNPFDCTCESILWFVKWLNSTNTTSVPGLTEQYTCNTPLAYFNRSIMVFDPLSCKDSTPFQALFVLSSASVILLLVVALFVRFQGWRIQFYWNIMVNRTLGFSDAAVGEGRQFEYDAYVIHAEADGAWVERRLLPLENEKCKFCLEIRDSNPGMSQLESIVNNIRNSRKILFVVTETLLRDPWCRRFTARQALHQVIEASRDSVVLVFLQDVHDHRLSRTLFLRRGMLRSCCVLYWPVHKERVAAFHQKLLIALGMTNRLHD
ncbi:unnamed protein product, partial [Tetraodon nigroviridis]